MICEVYWHFVDPFVIGPGETEDENKIAMMFPLLPAFFPLVKV